MFQGSGLDAIKTPVSGTSTQGNTDNFVHNPSLNMHHFHHKNIDVTFGLKSPTLNTAMIGLLHSSNVLLLMILHALMKTIKR